jgi:Na+-driven multidrug efflux pump
MNLAILNVMSQCFIFSIIIPIALAVTAMNRVVTLRKDKNYDLIIPYLKMYILIGSIYNFILFGISMIMPNTIAQLFMNPEDNTNSGISGSFRAIFFMLFIGLLFDTYKNLMSMTFQALQLNKVPMQASLVGVWGLGMPLAAALAFPLGVAGIVLGFSLGNILVGGYLLCHWHSISDTKNPKLNKDMDSMMYFPKKCCSMLFAAPKSEATDTNLGARIMN